MWHRIRDDADPIRQALRSRGLPSSLVRTVDEIDETIYGSWFHGDGKEEWEDDPDGEHRKHVRGGSFLINSLFEVFVTPNANRMFVAKLVEAGTNTYRDHEKVAAVEIEYGLRCPECKRKGCSVAVHDKERADKAAAEKADREEREAKPIIEIKGVSYRVISHNERRVLLGPKMALETLEGKAMILMAGDEKPYDFTWMLYYHSPNCVTDTKTGQEWYYHISNGRWQKGDGRNIRWYGY